SAPGRPTDSFARCDLSLAQNTATGSNAAPAAGCSGCDGQDPLGRKSTSRPTDRKEAVRDFAGWTTPQPAGWLFATAVAGSWHPGRQERQRKVAATAGRKRVGRAVERRLEVEGLQRFGVPAVHVGGLLRRR